MRFEDLKIGDTFTFPKAEYPGDDNKHLRIKVDNKHYRHACNMRGCIADQMTYPGLGRLVISYKRVFIRL